MANDKAYSSYQAFLMHKPSAAWVKLIDIRDFPDLQGDPNPLDTTTLSDKAETQIPGIKRSGEKKFIALYDKTNYNTLKGFAGSLKEVGLWFGASALGEPNGSNGKFEGKGYISVKVLGKGVDEVLEMEITVAMQEAFTYQSS